VPPTVCYLYLLPLGCRTCTAAAVPQRLPYRVLRSAVLRILTAYHTATMMGSWDIGLGRGSFLLHHLGPPGFASACAPAGTANHRTAPPAPACLRCHCLRATTNAACREEVLHACHWDTCQDRRRASYPAACLLLLHHFTVLIGRRTLTCLWKRTHTTCTPAVTATATAYSFTSCLSTHLHCLYGTATWDHRNA